jgi:hypothetical protein
MNEFEQYQSDIEMLQKHGYSVIYDGMSETILRRGSEKVTVEYGVKYVKEPTK